MTAAVAGSQRFTRRQFCPICGGHSGLPPGKGLRCYGFLSEDGAYAHCTREEFAGVLELDAASTYAHRLHGSCRCGQQHGSEVHESPRPARSAAPAVYTRYEYRGIDGELLAVHVRKDRPGEPKVMWWETANGQTSKNGAVKPELLPLWGKERLAEKLDVGVVLVEGEKAADVAYEYGLAAVVSLAGGASQTKFGSALEPLKGRAVFLWPDNDEEGRSFMRRVATALEGVAASVHWLDVPGLPPKGDAADYFAAGRAVEELRGCVQEMPPLTSEPRNLTSNPKDTSFEVGLVSTQSRWCEATDLLADDGADELVYLPVLGRDGYIVVGWSHLLAGYPRVGKTEFVVACIESWLRAGHMVLLFTEEPKSLWRQRLRQRGVWPRGLRLYFGLGVDPSEMLTEMRAAAESIVVLDSIRNLLQFEDENNNSEVARKINPWVAAARECAKTLELVHHMRKGAGDNGEGIAGGHALLGAVDIALELVRDKNQAATRRKIRAYARLIQPGELLYELAADGQLRALGDPDQVALAEVERRVQEELTDEWLKTKAVWEALADPQPSLEQVRRALTGLAKQGVVDREPPLSVGSTAGKTIRWRLRQTSPPTTLSLGRRCRLCGARESLGGSDLCTECEEEAQS